LSINLLSKSHQLLVAIDAILLYSKYPYEIGKSMIVRSATEERTKIKLDLISTDERFFAVDDWN